MTLSIAYTGLRPSKTKVSEQEVSLNIVNIRAITLFFKADLIWSPQGDYAVKDSYVIKIFKGQNN